MPTIPQRVKTAREALGLTKVAFARRLLYDRSYIGDIEAGKKTAGPRFISQLEMIEREIDSGLVRNPSGQVSIKGKEIPDALIRVPIHAEEAYPVASTSNRLRAVRERTGLSQKEFAKKIGYEIGVVQAIEERGARITERMAEKIAAKFLIDIDELLDGSDSPRLMDESGRSGTFGATPNVDLPPGKRARYVPLLSWAQAGGLDAAHVDDAYSYEGTLAVNVSDRKAFGVTIRGDSMIPELREGDDAIVCPTWQPRNGDTVIARTTTGDVMCKVFQSKEGGQRVILSSYNPAHPPIELSSEEIAWIYPVGQVVRNYRKT